MFFAGCGFSVFMRLASQNSSLAEGRPETQKVKSGAGQSSRSLALLSCLLLISIAAAGSTGCSNTSRSAGSDDIPIAAWRKVEDLPIEVTIFDRVFWEPLDTVSLRKLIRETPAVQGKRVLEIGTGSGLLSLCALQAGASYVVATDVNPNAVANARYNVEALGAEERFEVRQVSRSERGAFAVIGGGETFDVIISNPPWVDRKPGRIEDFALYDEGFLLMRTLFEGLPKHLNRGGKALLAYGSVSGIRMLYKLSAEKGYEIRVIDDDRELDGLEEEFLPGMLLEVTVPRP
jgi:SAM-dependent methyltransferase